MFNSKGVEIFRALAKGGRSCYYDEEGELQYKEDDDDEDDEEDDQEGETEPVEMYDSNRNRITKAIPFPKAHKSYGRYFYYNKDGKLPQYCDNKDGTDNDNDDEGSVFDEKESLEEDAEAKKKRKREEEKKKNKTPDAKKAKKDPTSSVKKTNAGRKSVVYGLGESILTMFKERYAKNPQMSKEQTAEIFENLLSFVKLNTQDIFTITGLLASDQLGGTQMATSVADYYSTLSTNEQAEFKDADKEELKVSLFNAYTIYFTLILIYFL